MSTLIALLIVCLVAGLLWWAITKIPLPEPMGMIVQVVFVVIFALVLLGMLFGSVPVPTLRL
jgi:hypothetical protein